MKHSAFEPLPVRAPYTLRVSRGDAPEKTAVAARNVDDLETR
jgi:hypothetical protein